MADPSRFSVLPATGRWAAAAIALLVLIGPVIPARGAAATDLSIAAASDLRFALEEIARLAEGQGGVRMRLTFGSSGQLASQIEQGAPFDLFFSADEGFILELARKGLVRRETVQLYAIGRIVLWVRTASPLTVAEGLTVLLDERIRFIAIANPEHAPYGRAAVQALRTAGLYERVSGRLVLGENVSQTLQFVQSGNADVGMVALSLAVAPSVRPTGRYWLIPAYLHRPIRQAAGVLAASRQIAQAQAFLSLLNGSAGRQVMRRYGFTLPGEPLP
ncbi:MAG TPA: molybdate ABC transporter substrate-binding protein [bacterium]|nr:molybdate ABC transporter substrate-binding protein [bacterium]